MCLNAPLTISMFDAILCPMKAAIYLTNPAEVRKARLNQPRVSSEQARHQRERLQRASEKFSDDARKEPPRVGAWARPPDRPCPLLATR